MDSFSVTVQKMVWEGKIPIEFRLYDQNMLLSKDVEAKDSIVSYLAMVPRLTYLPLLIPQIRKHFYSFSLGKITNAATSWFEYRGIPLKWHYPVGLLYDLHVTRFREECTVGEDNNDGDEVEDVLNLPWRVTVYWRGCDDDDDDRGCSKRYPEAELPLLVSSNSSSLAAVIEDYYISMLKQADFLRHGNVKRTMKMSSEDRMKLWQSLSFLNFDQFWRINSGQLLGSVPGIRNIPFRLYCYYQRSVKRESGADDDRNEPAEGAEVENAVLKIFQEPFSPLKSDGKLATLRDLINQVVLEGEGPFALSERENSELVVILHGIELDLNVPLLWLSLNMSFLDNFLHLVLVQTMSV